MIQLNLRPDYEPDYKGGDVKLSAGAGAPPGNVILEGRKILLTGSIYSGRWNWKVMWIINFCLSIVAILLSLLL